MARRIGRGLLLAVMLALLILPVLFMAHPVSYVPFIAAVLMVAASWFYLQLMRRSVSVGVESMAPSCERGEKTPLSVTLVNRAPLPCVRLQLDFFVTDLFGDFDELHSVSCSVRARETDSLDFDVRFAHLGTYSAGVSQIIVHDLLGLFSAKIGDGARRQVVVRPRRVALGQVNATMTVPDDSQRIFRPIAADDVDYASVREYRFGDPLKTVHWNLSARNPNGALFTRLFEVYVNPSLAVIIDPYAATGDREELMSLFDGMVEVAASLSEQARMAGIDAEVRYLNRSGVPSSTRLVTADDADDLVHDMMSIVSETGGKAAGGAGAGAGKATGGAGAGAAAAGTGAGAAAGGKTAGAAAAKAEAARAGAAAAAGAAEEMLREAGLRSHGCGNVALIAARADAGEIAALTEISFARRNAMAFVAVPRDLSEKEREKRTAPWRQLSAAGGSWWAIESNEVMTEVVGL